MAAFIPHDFRTPLPIPGALETDALDFKGELNRVDGKPDYVELAKDIAAFANSHGGTILVGAYEDRRRGVLGRLQGMTDVEAKEVRDAYSRAATKFCSPTPVTDSDVIDHPSGRIVAVNVWPFPGQAVGARNGDLWCFPWRSGIETKTLLPEQLAMLMIPDLRRKVALLRAIPKDAVIRVDEGYRQQARYIVEINEQENYVKLATSPHGSQMFEQFALEQVERVWKTLDMWEIHMGPRQKMVRG